MDVEIYAAPLRTVVDGRQQTMVVESIRDLSKQINYSHEQKLSELGKLATGVAHEIHNPLASVRLALHGLRQSIGDLDPEIVEYLELVDAEVDKCVSVTERLLRLGMSPSEVPELIDITTIVSDTLSLVRWEAETNNVALTVELQPGLRTLASDSELRMVVLNLAQNAFHAMPQGGRLAVTSRSRHPWIEIEFSDSGIGIEAERLARIFDPFYSRRADGAKGTGLGLSIVRTIVENYGGSIQVQSEPGQGSVFTVRLPDAAVSDGQTQ
jgi:signal transduction histidine kinase